jgi:hypothetical protein
VDNGEVFDDADIGQVVQPLAVVLGELFASPLHHLGGARGERVKREVRRTVIVVIAFDAGSIHGAYDIDARLWVGAITDEVAKESIMSALLFPRVRQYRLEGFQVRMNISHDRELHPTVTSSSILPRCRTLSPTLPPSPLRLFNTLITVPSVKPMSCGSSKPFLLIHDPTVVLWSWRCDVNSTPSYLRNNEAVVKAFGYWPSFHDAPVVALSFTEEAAGKVEMTLHGWELTGVVDESGFYKLIKHHLVRFAFREISNADLGPFAPGNILFALKLSSPEEFEAAAMINVTLDSAMGGDLCGSFSARSGEVLEVIPCDKKGDKIEQNYFS